MTRPLQVYIEETELERLEVWARARGWTKSQAVRAAVRAMTGAAGRGDPLLDASGMIDGLPTNLSSDIDRYLEGTFVVTSSTARRRRKPAARRRVRR
jgi:hypothetical protein